MSLEFGIKGAARSGKSYGRLELDAASPAKPLQPRQPSNAEREAYQRGFWAGVGVAACIWGVMAIILFTAYVETRP